jgi:hypothetical protein
MSVRIARFGVTTAVSIKTAVLTVCAAVSFRRNVSFFQRKVLCTLSGCEGQMEKVSSSETTVNTVSTTVPGLTSQVTVY